MRSRSGGTPVHCLMRTVAIYGAGQLGHGVAEILRGRHGYEVKGPFGRDARRSALGGGADVVVIATTTRLVDVADDIRLAVESGSNVLVSAEEAANPYLVDPEIAETLDQAARSGRVTIAGAGVNPGLIFDALVLTLLGAVPDNVSIAVRRTVDISGFGDTVRRRIGVGLSPEEFAHGVIAGTVLGHAGFPQSMSVVARALGLSIDRIERTLEPLLAERDHARPPAEGILDGRSAGVNQRYVAIVDGEPWFTASFFGHVALASIGLSACDVIEFRRDESVIHQVTVVPGFDAQVGSRNMVANSIDRVIDAPPGWLTADDLRPAAPRRSR